MSTELIDLAETRARTTDPQTSVAAAEAIAPKLTLRCSQFLNALKKLGKSTANEVAQQVAPANPGLFGSIRRRASDLHQMGVIAVVDRRACRVTGKVVSVYGVVE